MPRRIAEGKIQEECVPKIWHKRTRSSNRSVKKIKEVEAAALPHLEQDVEEQVVGEQMVEEQDTEEQNVEKPKEKKNQKIKSRSQSRNCSKLFHFDLPPLPVEGEVVNQGSVLNKRLMCGGNYFEIRQKPMPMSEIPEPIYYTEQVVFNPTPVGDELLIYKKSPATNESTAAREAGVAMEVMPLDDVIVVADKRVRKDKHLIARKDEGMEVDMMSRLIIDESKPDLVEEAKSRKDEERSVGSLLCEAVSVLQGDDESTCNDY